MSFDSIENIISLLCTIGGLLYCVFKYIESPKREYRFLIVFFLANFLSVYYWTVYELVMQADPEVSEFVVYLGWNVGYLFLLLAAFFIRQKEARRYFHPVILLPILFGVSQFILYIRFGSVLNNIWEVGTTTLTMVFCVQELAYYRKHKENRKNFPWFSLLALAYLVFTYGMWTASCFDWESEVLSPYIYCSALASVISVFLPYGAKKYCEAEEGGIKEKSTSEHRFQVLLQSVISIVIIGICAAGFFITYGIKNTLADENGVVRNEGQLVIYLFIISAVLILLIFVLLYVMTSRYRREIRAGKKFSEDKRSRVNLIFTIAVTFALMGFAAVYNSVILYNSSVVSVYEDGQEAIKAMGTELENYLTESETSLRVAADSVDFMQKNGSSVEEIRKYLVDQTTLLSKQFDENFTGMYAYINGEYLDGINWVPPEGYEPTERDWYKAVVAANGAVEIVSPYIDAQSGSAVITIGKRISDSEGKNQSYQNVVCLDLIVNHIMEISRNVQIAGKGFGMVVNADGFIVAHREEEFSGGNLTTLYDRELLDSIRNEKDGRGEARIQGENYTLFTAPVMDQWYAVIAVSDTELFEETGSQLTFTILVSLITFCLITFFYILGYKSERIYRSKVEAMNIQIVTALAAAIDAKDNYTNGHSSRVAEYSKKIAAHAGYSKEKQDEIYMMGLLHDVGKIGVPDEVINKPSRLTEEEYELIKQHPVIGSSILESIKEKPELAIGARGHHERYDGKGYPDGIAGENIPVEARIIAVADAYDAMTSRRSYRDVMTQEKVLEEIENGAGTQFDPRFARVMIELIRKDTDFTMREKTEAEEKV